MTDKEKAVVMAHTGICMLTGEKFSIFYKYIEELMGRPVFTHELANAETVNQIKEKSKEDFLRLCKDEFAQETCEDCISRQAVEKITWEEPSYTDALNVLTEVREKVRALPPVTPKPKTGYCKDCKWWKDSDGLYRRGGHAESQCPINRREVFEGNGYCYMFEPQESEEA